MSIGEIMKSKIQLLLTAVFLMLLVQNAVAGNEPDINTFRSAEVDRQSIKVASDGSGIIANFSCRGCGFKVLKVTTETKGYLKNKEIGVVQLVQQSKANVGFVLFALDSNTVYEIRFSH
jgi:hypothetical protein